MYQELFGEVLSKVTVVLQTSIVWIKDSFIKLGKFVSILLLVN